jgi:putative lysine/arginine/ornithine/histidine/octopine transport system permease protein
LNFAPIEDWLELPADSVLEVWEGLVITLQLLCGSVLLAFALALPLALAATSGKAWPVRLARGYSAAFRGTPLLVQLFILYYGVSQFEAVRQSPAWWLLEDAFYCGLLALSLNLAAYMAEDLRAGILAVPVGEREAALAMGMSPFQCYRWIVLPAAWRIATPALGNEVIAQLKATALVSTITVLDLTGVARRLSNASYTTDALVIAGVVYAAITLVVVLAVRRIERRFGPAGRR